MDFAGAHFVLRVFSLYSPEKPLSVESYASIGSLIARLTELGIPSGILKSSLASLGLGCDAMWTNVEVARSFFGDSHERRAAVA